MDAPPQAERDALISQFCAITGAPPASAEGALSIAGWDFQQAVGLHYAQQEEDTAEPMNEAPSERTAASDPTPPAVPGGGRTLDGRVIPDSNAGSSAGGGANSSGPHRGGLRTLGDIRGAPGSSSGPPHGHDDDSDEDQDFFAGGEKSGLAVQNPNSGDARDRINSIIDRARRGVARPGGDDEQPTTRFTGRGMTLGGDDAPSRVIEDPLSSIPQPASRVHRTLHLWQDGLSVDDGELRPYSDPANRRVMDMISQGHAPLDFLNVEPGQEVDVELQQHRDEKYVRPKQKYKPFSGQGQRLGSPTPGGSATSAPPPAASTSSGGASSIPSINVDASQPTLTLQIRLGDGTRLQSRFNTLHTIGDVYDFVSRASPASQAREWALMTTFPSKELMDKAQVLGDIAEFKRGGVVVQKWK